MPRPPGWKVRENAPLLPGGGMGTARQGKKISCHSNMKRFALIVDLVMRFNGAMVYYNELYSHKFINMI